MNGKILCLKCGLSYLEIDDYSYENGILRISFICPECLTVYSLRLFPILDNEN